MILTAFVSKIRSGMQPSETCSFLIYKTIYLYFQQENHNKTETYELHIPRELERQSVQVFVFSETIVQRFSVNKAEVVIRRCFVKKGVLKKSPVTLLKKRLWHRCFPVYFAKFLRTSSTVAARFSKKGFLKNFVIFTKKNTCAFRNPAASLKRDFNKDIFLWMSRNFLTTPFLKNICKWLLLYLFISHPENIYLFKGNNKNARKRFGICSKLTIKTPERHHWSCYWIFIINSEQISHILQCLLYWL